MTTRSAVRHDLQAGLTVALVAIPQCMAFATIAGLPPVVGLYAAVVMGLVGSAISKSPKLNIGPAVTTSSLVFAVLMTTAPNEPERWPALAGHLAVLVGLITILAAILRVGNFVRFVARSVLVGLVVGAAILIFGTQLAPYLGLARDSTPQATLIGILWSTVGDLRNIHASATLMATGTLLFILLGNRLVPRAPMAFVALVLGGVAAWALPQWGIAVDLEPIEAIKRAVPRELTPWDAGAYGTDFLVGGAAIALIGIIQTLAIAKALANRDGSKVQPKRELIALGAANLFTGVLHGLPGAGSFARSALNEMAGARTRLSGLLAAIAIALIVLLAAPLTHYITRPAIAGLLLATAFSIVDWKEFGQLLRRGGNDRIVLLTTVLCVFVLPIHWAVLIGLALSIAFFLRRVSRLHVFEMVGAPSDHFHERAVDAETGKSVITMLQVEGPLFFAHADQFANALSCVFERGPRVTILRMRRTQQIDFSVIAALERVTQDYAAGGGTLIICGLTPEMRSVLAESALGHAIRPEHLLETTRKVFGSAHRAIKLAEGLVADRPADRPVFRTELKDS